MSTPRKPVRREFKPAYEWNAIQAFIEKKYNIALRGYKKEEDGVYRDFWHWLVDQCGIQTNGCYIHLPEDYEGTAEEWQKEIMGMLLKEFPELKTERIWVNW
jgi:hypothetical protein